SFLSLSLRFSSVATSTIAETRFSMLAALPRCRLVVLCRWWILGRVAASYRTSGPATRTQNSHNPLETGRAWLLAWAWLRDGAPSTRFFVRERARVDFDHCRPWSMSFRVAILLLLVSARSRHEAQRHKVRAIECVRPGQRMHLLAGEKSAL